MRRKNTIMMEFSGPYELYRQIYKATPCGPTIQMVFRGLGKKGKLKTFVNDQLPGQWRSIIHGQLVALGVSSIVEGSDIEVPPIWLQARRGNISSDRFYRAVEYVNDEATLLWNEANEE